MKNTIIAFIKGYLLIALLFMFTFVVMQGDPIAEYNFEDSKALLFIGLGWPLMLAMLIIFAGGAAG